MWLFQLYISRTVFEKASSFRIFSVRCKDSPVLAPVMYFNCKYGPSLETNKRKLFAGKYKM